MKKLWQPADIIDLYALLQMDEQERGAGRHAALAQRDRNIYLLEISRGSEEHPSSTENPAALVRQWLSARRRMLRKNPDSPALPGTLWRETFVIGRTILTIGGLLSGICAATAFLVYSGKEPLNVSAFFGLFVFLPVLLLMIQFVFFLLRLLQKRILAPGGLSILIGRLLLRGLQRLQKKLWQSRSAKTRLDSAAFAGRLSLVLRHSPEQSALVLWPAFILLQWTAIGLHLGLLGATLAKVVFSDIAFAWQSSLQLSPEIVAHLVQWVALPWSWLPNTCPDLAQIQGSQLVFKEGMAHMATENLRSWWPFLCLSMFFYGLLPRLALLLLGERAKQYSLDRLVQALPEIKRLARRMLQQQLDTTRPEPAAKTAPHSPAPQSRQSAAGDAPRSRHESTRPQPDAAQIPAGHFFAATASALALIPEEILEGCPAACLRELADLLGSGPAGAAPRIHPYNMYDNEGGAKNPLAQILSEDESAQAPEQILLIQEAWQPPIREHEGQIRALRDQLGPEPEILILLIGKPGPASILTPADPVQVRIWQQKMRALADPQLFVHPLISASKPQ